MKSIVIFGAGRSSGALVEYLIRTCTENEWHLIIGDANASDVRQKVPNTSVLSVVEIDVHHAADRTALIRGADLVISLLPPALHILIAHDCVNLSKTLLTASYVDAEIKKLESEITHRKLLFVCEMGLDPGIDHMSAMQIIHRLQQAGAVIHAFRSHTGGLVAPESDDNAWHYKVSWNPANVVRAGSSGAVYKENGETKKLLYRDLFEHTGSVRIDGLGVYAYYPNRDSLSYIPVYRLESADTFLRTTLRHPDYCTGWKNLVRAGLTDDSEPVPNSVHTIAAWAAPLLPFVDQSNQFLYDELGLFENNPLPAAGASPAQVLQSIIEKKWQMKQTDRDMILMLHEFEYTLAGRRHTLRSTLVVKGETAARTAMAKTVGLPLGISARLILEGKIAMTGLHIPIIPEIYIPVLKELEKEGIVFSEVIS